MDPALVELCRRHGCFLTSEAHDLGYRDNDIREAVRAGLWHRIRRGAFTLGDIWRGADREQRHRIRIRAVTRSMGGRVAVSHISSLVERGVPTWEADLTKVHVTRLDRGAGRIEPDVVHHVGRALEGDIEEVNGLLVVRAARGLVEAAGAAGVREGLVLADAAVGRGLVQPDDLEATYDRMQRWPHTRPFQLVIRLYDGLSGSPGETVTRYLCWTQRLPRPVLQVPIVDHHGVTVAVVDFLFEQLGVLGEFDGRIKYGRLLKPGQTPGDAVFEEKRREDLIREITGLPMVRFVTPDFSRPREMAARVRRLALRRSG